MSIFPQSFKNWSCIECRLVTVTISDVARDGFECHAPAQQSNKVKTLWSGYTIRT